MTYPDPLAIVGPYLDARFAAIGDQARAFAGVPDPRPPRFVRLMDAGSTVRSVAHRDARVVVECWERSEKAAAALGDLVFGWLCDLATPGGIVPQGPDGWLGGPYPQPDPDTRTPRSVMTVILRQGRQ